MVSFDSEALVLVDDLDREIGRLDKASCHDGDGVLHRAFSLFLFNGRRELLLQQRGPETRLWPLSWSNSCCSHPRWGERVEDAIHRRLGEELGLAAELHFLFRFQYSARFSDEGTERELCRVCAGRTDREPNINRSEVEAWRFISPDDLDAELEASPRQFTPWFKLEWKRIREEFGDTIPGP